MFNPMSSSIGHTMDSIDNLPKQPTKSPLKANGQIRHLTPDSRSPGSRSLAKSMQDQIDDAAHHPSTSKTPSYISLLAAESNSQPVDYWAARQKRLEHGWRIYLKKIGGYLTHTEPILRKWPIPKESVRKNCPFNTTNYINQRANAMKEKAVHLAQPQDNFV